MLEFDKNRYGKLLAATVPSVIASKAEYARTEEIFNGLFGKKRSPEEDRLFDLLANLMEEYEFRTLAPLPDLEPVEVLKALMRANDLRQNELAGVFGTQSVVSEVLSGKREITKKQAKLLAEKFRVKIEAFI